MIIEDNPRKKYKKIGIIGLAVAVLGWLIYQQVTISALKKIVMPTAGQPTAGETPSPLPAGSALSVKAQDVKKAIAENEKSIHGVVKMISGSILTVEADIIDFSKFSGMKDEDFQKSLDDFPKTKKTYTVKTNDKTEFTSKKLADIKAGDLVQIDANEPVYSSDTLTVVKISYSGPSAATDSKTIIGKVVKVDNKAVVIGPMFDTGQNVRTSAAGIGSGTKILKREFGDVPKDTVISLNDIKAGDIVETLAADPIGDRKEFEATRLILMIFPAKK
jgi:ribosomal protein S17